MNNFNSPENREARIRELEMQVESLSVELDCVKKELVKRPMNSYLARMVKEMPISYIRNNHGKIRYEGSANGSWTHFLALAKLIHQDAFFEKRRHDGFVTTKMKMPKLTELSTDELTESVDMLNEMIPIFNKYFRKNHPINEIETVVVDW